MVLFVFIQDAEEFDVYLNVCKAGCGKKSLKKSDEDNLSGDLCGIGKGLTTGLDGGLLI